MTTTLSTPPARASAPEVEAGTPLSFGQQSLWFLNQIDPHGGGYNTVVGARWKGPLRVATLRRAFHAIVRRHEILRTVIVNRRGAPVQIVRDAFLPDLPVVDLSRCEDAEALSRARRLAAEHTARPFKLDEGPLFRLLLVRLSAEDHAFVFATHHIVCDGWSVGILFRELTHVYQALATGRRPALPPLGAQYGDYARWQWKHLTGEACAPALQYWRTQLEGLASALELPTDCPRPSTQTFGGAACRISLSPPVADRLRAMADETGATLFMSLLAGFYILLHRLTGRTDLVVGCPLANRTSAEFEALIGFFVNTLPFRVRVSSHDTYLDVLRRVRAAALGAFAHQHMPFEQLVEQLRPQREASRNPFYQIVFAFQNAMISPRDAAGLAPFLVEVSTTGFDLECHMWEAGERIEGSLIYNRDLFRRDRALVLAAQLERVLTAVADAPATPVADLPVLEPAEHAALVAWGRGPALAAGTTVLEEIERQAAVRPEAVAVADGVRDVRYGDLIAEATALAASLRARGVGPEARVGVCLERGADLLIALLAVWKAGGAYVPIEPGEVEARRRQVLAAASCTGVITRRAFWTGEVPGGSWTWWWGETPRGARECAWPRLTSDHLAYVLFTSGTTGTPKGVMVTHGGLANYVAWSRDTYGVGPESRAPLHSAISFDLAITSLWTPLSAGGCVEIVGEPVLDHLARALAGGEPWTLVKMTPAHLDVLARLGVAPQSPAALVVGGAAVCGAQLAAWRATTPLRPVINEYGPTETVVGCSWHAAPPGPVAPGAVPIGVAAPNTELYVCDAIGTLMPSDAVGELYVGGAQVARGYLDDPARTAAQFVPNPHGAPGSRMYRTGDAVRLGADGVLAYHGRVDRQVKIRGCRVEPGEVEAVLREQPGVAAAAIVPRMPDDGSGYLAAYVVTAPGARFTPATLRAALAARLPDYLVPLTIERLDALPLTAHGKVDASRLPPEAAAATTSSRPFVAPRKSAELLLANIWTRVLRVNRVGIYDDFFELGGHSLLMAQLFWHIREAFGVSVPLLTLMEKRQLMDQADAIARASRREATTSRWSPLVAIQPNGTRPPLFLMHPIGGGVTCYVALTRYLGEDQPVYGIQAQELQDVMDAADPFTSMAEMAASYLEAIRTVQPRGPYSLGGWSFGGMAAYEMAQQVVAGGEKVALLALLDTGPMGIDAPALEDGILAMLLARELSAQTGKRVSLTYDDIRELPPDEQLTRVLEQLKAADIAPPDSGLAAVKRIIQGYRARDTMVRRYVVRPFDGRITYFVAQDVDPERDRAVESQLRGRADPIDADSAYGWTRYSREPIVVHRIPGSHPTIVFEPHVRALAACLREALAQRE